MLTLANTKNLDFKIFIYLLRNKFEGILDFMLIRVNVVGEKEKLGYMSESPVRIRRYFIEGSLICKTKTK
ncbi:MAG: hypothetical protein A2544_01470 [Candidatus Zambryskibacteria bacterium RIFOXYD2_FULL_43_10]|uniref:Uncharacterized protein n=1 Tax=Candidatus Zambryskibacteria bacterium RIFOXYD2_FULL_43_10 TaxID=1802782 RepID=A0A1G2V9A3_9BACT|nr:MAG: hypothetical protein A2544_01470 [Candidatus Zambryskibacteria bacterium RIFOXYD2_FULL_43_10]